MTAAVEFRDLRKSYDGVVALDGVNLVIEPGEFLTLLGPSGSGKTTLLNVVSGMVLPSSGSVLIAGRDVTQVPPRQRGLGMVFQNYALLPHMTVFDNVAFPLRIRKMSRTAIEREVMAVLTLVRLADFAKRKPRELSGGQQQRVSIARCLVYKPKLILMDEPLGALDKKLRVQLQFEIKRIHEELGVTILYVTHDQEEALVLSDRICVMNNARIEQTGTPNDLYFRPYNEFVADFLGESNLIPASVEGVVNGIADIRTDDGSHLRATAQDELRHQCRVKVLVRPEAVRISPHHEKREHGIEGIIHCRSGNQIHRCGRKPECRRATQQQFAHPKFRTGRPRLARLVGTGFHRSPRNRAMKKRRAMGHKQMLCSSRTGDEQEKFASIYCEAVE